VTVVALGGSVTANHGTGNHSNGYTSRLFAWIETTFPNEGHQLLNHATPATTSRRELPLLFQKAVVSYDGVPKAGRHLSLSRAKIVGADKREKKNS
jgi:hypothetical protein